MIMVIPTLVRQKVFSNSWFFNLPTPFNKQLLFQSSVLVWHFFPLIDSRKWIQGWRCHFQPSSWLRKKQSGDSVSWSRKASLGISCFIIYHSLKLKFKQLKAIMPIDQAAVGQTFPSIPTISTKASIIYLLISEVGTTCLWKTCCST